MRIICALLALTLSVGFWVAIDALGAPHAYFDLFDVRSVAGYVAWMCAVFATKCGVYAIGGKSS